MTDWLRKTRIGILGLLLVGCGEAPLPPQAVPEKSSAPTPTAATPRAPHPDDWFEDVTDRTNISFTYSSGRSARQFTILETVGGGVAMVDFDRDDDADLFFPAGGEIHGSPLGVSGLANQMFRNEGGFEFRDVGHSAGLATIPMDYSHGVTVVDFNQDGWPDLFVTCYGKCRLLCNNGCGGFDDVTDAAGLNVTGWNTAAAWGDIDRNGDPDVFITGYLQWDLRNNPSCTASGSNVRDVCPPQQFPSAPNRLFRNRGDGTFEDATVDADLQVGKGLGVVAADINADGWLDFYVANDVMANQLYLGGPDLPWREVGLASGAAVNEFGAAEGSMGVDFCDFDGDGHGDLWVTNFELEDNSLYRGSGEGHFSHATMRVGLGGSTRRYVKFGTGWSDFNGDGWLEPFVVSGHVLYHSPVSAYQQPAFLYRSDAGRRFVDITDLGGSWFSQPHAARGAAIGDLDNDGAPDLVIVAQDEPAAFLRNRLQPPHWVRLELIGVHGDRDAWGARVSMKFRGRTLVRWNTSGAGYLSQFDRRCLLPAEDDRPVDVVVDWPDGRNETFSGLNVCQTHSLIQGHGTQSIAH